jgi:hypothetical protein
VRLVRLARLARLVRLAHLRFAQAAKAPLGELLETVASGRSSCRRAWQTRDTYPVYGEHRRREIRPRSRFILNPAVTLPL